MEDLLSRLKNPILSRIIDLLPSGLPIFLVGGAVRDALLGRQDYDLDFVTAGDALKLARKLADELGGAYFPLDSVRNVARIIVRSELGGEPAKIQPYKIDISRYQGPDLHSDLFGRDFTINAMALPLSQPETLVDPLHGADDLIAKRLRACSPTSFLDDPIRILRAVRLAIDLDLNIQPETLGWLRLAIPRLVDISAERLRDELFRMLSLAHPSSALRVLDMFGVLEQLLPEVSVLKGVQQSPPHVMDVWNHTMDSLNRLEILLELLAPAFDPEKASNLTLGMVALILGRYREQLQLHLDSALNPERPHRALLFLAGLYHDVGKSATQSTDETGQIRFLGHDQAGSQLAERRGQALKLSNLEISRLATIVGHHMRPSFLSHPEEPPTRKAIYHFFKATGAAGVDICILSLADVLATYGPTLPPDRWARHLEVVRSLLQAWWEDKHEKVLPPALVTGDDLQTALGLTPSPLIGYLLESIREAQVSGEVHNREEAIQLAGDIQKSQAK